MAYDHDVAHDPTPIHTTVINNFSEGNPDSKEAKRPELLDATQSLEYQIRECLELVGKLYDKLGPVLFDEDAEKSPPQTIRQGGASSLQNYIWDQNDGLYFANYRLRVLLERIDI